MKHWFSPLVTVLFLLGSTTLWADNLEDTPSTFQTSSGTHPTELGAPGSGATPAPRGEGRFKERREKFKEKHETFHSRSEERESKIREKLEQMIQEHPERADEIRQRFENKRQRFSERHDRRHERVRIRREHKREGGRGRNR
ncbi:MAG: hypothetical protein O6948_00035 [Deltaproteobacteria bacterium]|nr:hypothetical protein [Deltaproteobacteria bacterium]